MGARYRQSQLAREQHRYRSAQLHRKAAGEPVTIEKADIQSREKLKVSIMPEGLLATLKDEEVIALVRYLRTTEEMREKK